MNANSSTTCRVVTYILTVVASLGTILCAVLGALNGAGLAKGIFNNSVGNTSDKYNVELIPASYVFGTIWPINFIWTIVGSLYLVVSLFLPTYKSPVKMDPPLTSKAYFIFYILAFGLTNGWYFAFDAESLGWSFAILICTVASLYIAIAITLKAVASVASTLEKNNKVAVWLVRTLVQNGICTLATWVTCATMLGFVMILVFVDSPGYPVALERGLITNPNASSVGAGILLGLILVYFVLENFVLEKYLRYIFTIYPVLIFAFSGVVYKLVKTGGSRQNIIFGSVNLSICVALFLTRIALSIYRFKQRQSVSNSRNEKEKLSIDQI